MSITRRLPQSNIGREAALAQAKAKKDSPGTVNILKVDTTAMLDAQQPAYQAARDAVALAAANYHGTIETKAAKRAVCHMMVSHFIQVFNLAVARGEAPASHRAYFKLEVTSAAVPPIDTDEKLLKVADDLIKGNVNRLAAGGIAMSLPTIAQVTTAYNEFRAANQASSTKKDLLDAAQEAVDALNPAVDVLIKKLWADIEGQFASEAPESRRDNAREWGVAYFTVSETGTTQTVSITATNEDTTPNTEYLARLQTADVEAEANGLGQATLLTEEVGADTLIITAPGKVTQNIPVTLVAGGTLEIVVVLEG